MSSNDLTELMQEYRLEVRMLGTLDEPDPSSPAIAAMLEEIHRLRTQLAAQPGTREVAIPEWVDYMELNLNDQGPRKGVWDCKLVGDNPNPPFARPGRISLKGEGATYQEAIAAALAQDGGDE